MIALFVRSNHPHGFGYSYPGQTNAFGLGAHGYSVVGFVCRDRKQVERVIKHVMDNGIDLPDNGRNIYPNGKPERPYDRTIGREGVQRWYSGGPGDWDHLFTVPGNKVDFGMYANYMWGSRGDNRFCMIYEAKQLLSNKID